MARLSRIKWRVPLGSRFGSSVILCKYKLAQSCFSAFSGQIRAVGKMAQEGYAFRPLRHPGGLPCTGKHERLVNGSDERENSVTLTGLTCRAIRLCCRNNARAGALAASSLRERTESLSRSRRTTFWSELLAAVPERLAERLSERPIWIESTIADGLSIGVTLSQKGAFAGFMLPRWSASAHVCRGKCDRSSTDEWSPTKASGLTRTSSEAGLFLDDTIPDMSDQWCTAYFKRFKLQIGNILKETCSLPDGDGRDVEP
jgi:hypothetical protein